MANRFPTILQHRLPTLAGVHPNACFSITRSSSSSSRYYPVRRGLVFGIGVSFLSQFINMSGANSIIASARTTGSVDKVI